MKNQKTTRNKKRNFVWLLTILMFIGLLGLAEMSLAAGGEWVRKADTLAITWSAAAAVVDGKIYASVVNVVEAYDPVDDKFTAKAPMPTSRGRHAACAVNGKVYAIGGTPNNLGNDVLAAVEEYDPETDTWTKKSDMLTARHSLSLSVVDGKIYAIGGGKRSLGKQATTALDPAPVEVYDPKTDTWVKKPNMPVPRFAHASGIVRGKIYLVGGGGINPRVTVSAVSEYDPATGIWQEKAAIPTTRYTLTASVVNNKIYAIGGATLGGTWIIHSAVEEYDPKTDTWTKKTRMPIGATDVGSGVVDGKIYVIGGWLGGGNYKTWVDEYTPEGWPFSPEKSVSPQGKLVTTWGEMKLGR